MPIAADGNCLFRAVSYLLFDDENSHWPLRDLIIRFENLNAGIFEKRMTEINERTFIQHLRKLINPSSWATHIEVYAIATYFQATVYFCTDPPQPGTGGTHCWEHYKPLASCEALRYPVLTEPFLDNAKTLTHFELAYYPGCHYNSVVSVHTGVAHTSPPQLTGNITYHDQIIE